MRRIVCIIIIFVAFSCKNDKSDNSKSLKSESVTTLPFFNSSDFTPEWIEKGTNAYENIHTIPDFSLINQNGEKRTQQDYLGKIYVADFFFTSCTGICRSLSLHMKLLQEEYKNDNDVLLLSHSVTPELDSVSVLKAYADNYDVDSKKWSLVTGDKDAIYDLARTAYFSDKEFGRTNEPSEFIHTENFLLIDKKGRIRGVYNGTLKLSVKRLMKHINLLRNEE